VKDPSAVTSRNGRNVSSFIQALLKNVLDLLRSQLGQLLRGQNRILDHDPLHGYLPKLEARLLN